MAIIVSRATTALISGTGTITASTASTTVTGVGTLFTTEVDYVGKALYTSADVYIGTVSSINSDTSITLTAVAAVSVTAGAYKHGYLPKNTPLSNAEIDTNFINLNNSKLELTDTSPVNLANTPVRRDASGNFAANVITASLTGNVTGNATTASTLQTSRNINSVAFNGSADIVTPTIYDTDFSRIVNPGGARYVTSSSVLTGAIAISLPVAATNTMMRMTVKIYEYSTNRAFELHVGGYLFSGNTWANNPFAYIVGNPTIDRRFNIRFGYTSLGKMCVYIGELNSTWSYPQIYVTDVQLGYSGQSNQFITGWSIGFQSSAFESVTATIASTDVQVGYTAQALAPNNNYQTGSLGVGTAPSGVAGEIRATNAITSYYSDERLKENITPITDALAKVAQLRGVTYNANSIAESFGFTDKSKQVGVLAQQVEKVLPEAVKPAPFDIMLYENVEISKSGQNYKTVQYERMIPLLIQAINELHEEVKVLKGERNA